MTANNPSVTCEALQPKTSQNRAFYRASGASVRYCLLAPHGNWSRLHHLGLQFHSFPNTVDRSAPAPRPPWWMYVIAASVLGCLAMEVHVFFWGPETPFARLNLRDEALVVEEVSPGTAAARAGVRAGDRIINFAGRRTGSLADWDLVRLNLETNHPYALRIDRGGQHEELSLTLGRRSWARLPLFDQAGTIVEIGCALLCALLAIVLAFSQPHDSVARLGALALALLSLEMLSVNTGYFSECRRLPLPIGLFVWWPFVAGFLLPIVFFGFCAMFPGILFRARWAWTIILLPGVCLAGVILTLFGSVFLNAAALSSPSPMLADHFPDLVPQIGGSILLLYVIGGLGALVLNYRRSDVNQRRRIRVLVAGTLVAFLGLVPAEMSSLLRSSSSAARFFTSDGYLAFATLLFAVLPISWAHAIRRHQLFDIRVLLRQGLQYALARRVLMATVPALGLLLLADMLLHGQQPLVEILRGRGWIYLVLGALAALTLVNRQAWLDTLDRRFFRERYDAQRLLREVVEEIREARTFAQVAPRVVLRIEAALHPEFVALVSGEPRETTYRTVAIAPSGHVLAPLPVDSKLVAIVRLLGKPLEVTPSSSRWLAEQLPHVDTEFLRRERIQLVVPVLTGADRLEVLLALGLKRSEEPYSRDDLDLLAAIASSLAFLLERPAGPDTIGARRFEECPVCGACYNSGATTCATEGASLRPVFLPRLLEARYRLERRLGRGGMGSVYQATDVELERSVAVKVVREDLVGREETAQRFRREARTAASLSHPNIVTIHDFGVTKEARAYLVMELLEGSTIRERLRETGRFTTSQLLPVLREICSALDAAHRRQLVHRDLKPENIFLARSSGRQTCKVLDFGIAKFFDVPSEMLTADTAPGMLLGTPLYMSPEQRQGAPADPAWDLWALSVITYEMLVGGHPFQELSSSSGPAERVLGALSDIASLTPDAVAAWRTFFEKAFAEDPQLRPRSAEQFQSELDAVFSS